MATIIRKDFNENFKAITDLDQLESKHTKLRKP